MAIKLKHLSFSDIGRFVGEHSIDFDGLSDFVQVDAINLNTGGSSGSGKSTVFQAIEFLLGCNDTPTTILQSRLTKDKMSVSAVLEIAGRDIYVSRGKAGLSIRDGAEVFEGSSKLTEEKLQSLIGIKPDFLRKMFHKRQNEGGFFLNMKPSESYDFLADTLDIETWTKKLDLSEAKTKSLAVDQKSLDAALIICEESALECSKSLASLRAPAMDFDPELAAPLKSKEKGIKDKILELELREKKMLAEINSLKKEEIESIQPVAVPVTPPKEDISALKAEISLKERELLEKESVRKSSIRELTSKIEAIAAKARQIKSEKEKLPSLREALEDAKQKILQTKDNKCPTCFQDWHGGSKDSAFETYLQAARAIADSIGGIELLPGYEPLVAELSLLNTNREALEKQDPDTSDISALKGLLATKELEWGESNSLVLQAFSDKTSYRNALVDIVYKKYEKKGLDVSTKTGTERALLTGLLTDVATQISALESKQSTFKALTSQYSSSVQTLTEMAQLSSTRLKNGKEKLATTQEELEVATQASIFLKSFVSQLFQDCLRDIAGRATRILNRIPNMATASIQFESFKETKSGTVKAEINAVLSADGEIGVPIKSLSGGERASVDLAVDLAVIDVLEAIKGVGLDILILDEPFSGIDATGKEEILNILTQHYSGKKILIVDHSSETKEMISDKITIIRDNQTSKVQ